MPLSSLRDDRGLKEVRVKKNGWFHFPKRALSRCPCSTWLGPQTMLLRKGLQEKLWNIKACENIPYFLVRVALEQETDTFELRMRLLTAKSRHDAVSFAPINSPQINFYFFLFSIGEADATHMRLHTKSVLLLITSRKCFFLNYNCRLAYPILTLVWFYVN